MKAQLNVALPSNLVDRIDRDSNATNRSKQTIAAVALREFYNKTIPERKALLLREPATKQGRRVC